jgi:predicted component of type VI protein secretion system
MRDGWTQEINRSDGPTGIDDFLGGHDVRLVVVSGKCAGAQFRVQGDRHILGRGPGVDFQVNDDTMSRQHVALEYGDGEFRIRDLGSTNGVRINGRQVQVGELAHGDRIEIGTQVFRYVVELRDEEPAVYVLDSEE